MDGHNPLSFDIEELCTGFIYLTGILIFLTGVFVYSLK